MSRLDGRIAMVTGSASGIGQGCAIKLATDGAKVAVCDVNDQGAAETVASIVAAGGTAMAVHLDVSSEDNWVEAISSVTGSWGGLDILHNNAAAIGSDSSQRDIPITEGDVGVWDKVNSVNLRGVMLGCKHGIPKLIERGGGVIINTSSTSALWGGSTSPAYAASKSGIISITQHVAARYGRNGVRCIAILPGLIVPDNSPAPPYFIEMLLRQQPLPGTGRPEHIANVVAFLVSDDASFVTGIAMPIDAGQSCHRPWLVEELEYEDRAAAQS